MVGSVDLEGAVGRDFSADEGEIVEAAGQQKDGHTVFCIHDIANYNNL